MKELGTLMRTSKTPFYCGVFAIVMIYLFGILAAVGVMISTRPPTDFKEKTGIVLEFQEHEADWTDALFNGSSYFNIKFTDGSFFEAKGENYKNIDRELYGRLIPGVEITVKYEENHTKPNRIYGIEYCGKTYLKYDDVRPTLEKDYKSTLIACPIILVVWTGVAVALFVFNYKKNYQK